MKKVFRERKVQPKVLSSRGAAQREFMNVKRSRTSKNKKRVLSCHT
jgi:hypothetical protein